MTVPEANCSWQRFCDYALSFNGYALFSPGVDEWSPGGLADCANRALDRWERSGELPQTWHECRSFLFFEQRRSGQGLAMNFNPVVHWAEDSGEFSWWTSYVRALLGELARMEREGLSPEG